MISKSSLITRVLPVLVLSGSCWSRAQASSPIPIETAKSYFREADSICQRDHGQLWGISLCGPIMFVNPQDRAIVANHPDSNGALKAEDGVFVGRLPATENIANTAAVWSGVNWTQIEWPLPNDKHGRQILIAHELFHRIQGQLKQPQLNGGDNAHLDTLEGRYYLQLEWRALARALQAATDGAAKAAVTDALLFRAVRYELFPAAAPQEQGLELNEGLAEYTGVVAGSSTLEEQIQAALHDLASHTGNSTFVRSFAYATGPAYGLLLDRYSPGWRQHITSGKRLDSMLRQALSVNLPHDLQATATERAQYYDGNALRASETERETKRREIAKLNRTKFIDGPVLTVPLLRMNIQFDPRGLQPLEDAGTVYPALRITDDWGILEAKNGALLKPDWHTVIVVAPAAITGTNIKGDGWVLELKPGWKIIPATRKGDFTLAAGR